MRFEGFSALLCGPENSSRFSSYKAFAAFDVAEFFQRTGVAGQIAVCQLELFFQKIEISFLIDHQNSHNS